MYRFDSSVAIFVTEQTQFAFGTAVASVVIPCHDKRLPALPIVTPRDSVLSDGEGMTESDQKLFIKHQGRFSDVSQSDEMIALFLIVSQLDSSKTHALYEC